MTRSARIDPAARSADTLRFAPSGMANRRGSGHAQAPSPTPIQHLKRQRAGVSVPFLGADYDVFRICAVGMNHHDFGGLGANWWVCRGHIHDRLERGKRHSFAHGAGSYLSAIRASAVGAEPAEDIPSAQAAADGWRAASFVEAVKCSPHPKTSSPTRAMWHNCPPLFLREELRLLAPRVTLVLGRTHNAQHVVHTLDANLSIALTLWSATGPSWMAGRSTSSAATIPRVPTGARPTHPSSNRWPSRRSRADAVESPMSDQSVPRGPEAAEALGTELPHDPSRPQFVVTPEHDERWRLCVAVAEWVTERS